MVHVIDPFAIDDPLWLGLDEHGFRRKVFKVVDEARLNSSFLTAGLTIFEPGESSSLHNHPDSEEINFIVRGCGQVVADDRDPVPFTEHTFMFIPKGMKHQHINTGREPLWLVFVYGPHGHLPSS
jgi:oxalate decarboxylase/phosphoglucose isomerase-like protein (cupin superfamily)